MKIFTCIIIAILISGSSFAQIPADSLALWLKADVGVTTSGSNVTQWTDQSGKGRNATPTLATFPQLVLNELCGKPVLRFNTNTGLSTPAFQTFPNKRGTMFVVAKAFGGSGSANFGTLVSTYTGSGVTWQTGVWGATATYGWYDGSSGTNVSVTSSPSNQWGIVTYDRKYDDTLRMYKSGIFAGKLVIANNQPVVNAFRVGYNSFSEFLNGDMAEIIVYNKSLSEGEIYQVNTYLANKYCFNNSIASPTAAHQHRCGSGTLTLTASGGGRYRWYDSVSSTSILDTNASFTTPFLNANDTFYVARYNDTLESPRTQVIAYVHQLPVVSFVLPAVHDTVCLTDPAFTLTGGSPAGGTFSGTGVSGNTFNPLLAGLGTSNITYAYTDANSCSNTAVDNIYVQVCIPLSIKIDELSADVMSGWNRINWHTAHESSGYRFEVERSGDGRNFENIGAISARGTSGSYVFRDDQPLQGANHYRIKLVDGVGNWEYSSTVIATQRTGSVFAIQAYPNPASELLILKVEGNTGKDQQVDILDLTGRLLRHTEVSGNEIILDVSHLGKGEYFIRYHDTYQTKSIRITVR